MERWPHLPQEELQEPLVGFLLVGRAGHRFSFLDRPETAGAGQEVYTTLNQRLKRLCSRASWGGHARVNREGVTQQTDVTPQGAGYNGDEGGELTFPLTNLIPYL